MEHAPDITDEYQVLLRSEFLAEYLQRILDPPSVKVMRERRQAFFDELRPWLEPTLTKKPGYVWTPVADTKTTTDGSRLVKFSPDGELFFQAWLRRRHYNPVLYGHRN